MPSGPLREVGAGGLSVYFIQTKSAIARFKGVVNLSLSPYLPISLSPYLPCWSQPVTLRLRPVGANANFLDFSENLERF